MSRERGHSVKMTLDVWIPNTWGLSEYGLAEDVVVGARNAMSDDCVIRLAKVGEFKSARRPDGE